MSRLSSSVRWAILAVAILLLIVVGGFGVARALGAEEVLGDVRVAGFQLGGLTEEEALDALDVLEQQIATTPHRFVVAGDEAVLQPERVGFRLDRRGIVDAAMELGRDGGISEQFRWWLGGLFDHRIIPLGGSIDEAATEALLSAWDTEIVGEPPVPGGVAIDGTTVLPVYPTPGREIDRSAAPTLLLETFLDIRDQPTALPVVNAASLVTRAEVDRAVNEARLWLSGPVTLRAVSRDAQVVFSVPELAGALRSEVVDRRRIVLSFDPAAVEPVLAAARDAIELPPVDARFEIGAYEVTIVPGTPGTLIDPVSTAANLEAAAGSTTRIGLLPFEEGAEPDVTTEDLEALGVRHLVSSFTTYHDCCQNRVTNIHLFADTVNGAIVLPGESFSLNDHVGERTEEKGYLEDGTIIGGELVATVGGGVSQFATTFYNAVFWGGYEDVTHKPHSFYFSRYPEGIEATISWPLPELVFRNDDEQAVLIVTEYTDTSITVKFYGENDGRAMVGEQRGGRTNLEVVEEGGPDARIVTADVSGRFDFTEPGIEFRPNPAIPRGEQDRIQSPAQGWTVIVTRTITEGGEERVRDWRVRYLARREIVEVHPCDLPPGHPELPPVEECPDPTTTTTVPPSTTTTEPTSTTTAP